MSKRDKILRMIQVSEPDLTHDLAEELKNAQSHKKDIKAALDGIFNAVKGLMESDKSTHVKKNIREALLIPLDQDFSEDIEDRGLKEAVRIIQKRIIGVSQKDSLVRSLARDIYSDWGKISAEELESLAGPNGYLTRARALVEEWSDFDSMAENIANAVKVLGVYFWERFEEPELDRLIAGAKSVVDGLLRGKDVFEPMRDTASLFLDSSEILKSMRTAFGGLLVGDLILSAVGPAVGLRKGASLTDAIIDIGVKVAQKEHLVNVEKSKLEEFRSKLDTI